MGRFVVKESGGQIMTYGCEGGLIRDCMGEATLEQAPSDNPSCFYERFRF
jgi:hypothetical protein